MLSAQGSVGFLIREAFCFPTPVLLPVPPISGFPLAHSFRGDYFSCGILLCRYLALSWGLSRGGVEGRIGGVRLAWSCSP